MSNLSKSSACLELEYQVLFATDGDNAEIITDVLTGTKNEAQVFSVIHNCYTEPQEEIVKLVLCLPAKRPGGPKCLPVFHLRMPTTDAVPFLFSGGALPVNDLPNWLCSKTMKQTFKPLLQVVLCQNKASSKITTEFKSQIYWFRAKFVMALRKLYKITSSPHWLITTLGQFEIPFILVSTFYFFEKHECTVETIYHLARLFQQAKGKSLAAVNSYLELGTLFGASPWKMLVPGFTEFVYIKLAKDDFEVAELDKTINKFRGELLLSNQDLIHYIYLSFYQCYSRQNFLAYTYKTSPNHILQNQDQHILVTFIDEKFKHQMSTYYNKTTYLETHIQIHRVILPHIAGYSLCFSTSPHIQMWAGQSKEVHTLLQEVNRLCVGVNVSEDLQGLLDLAGLKASHPRNQDISKLWPIFLNTSPLYRCEFLRNHFFTVVEKDNIHTVWKQNVHVPCFRDWTQVTEKEITMNIRYPDIGFSLPTLKDQLTVSRHEYFNPRLPVFNLVLDLDLPVKGETQSFETIHTLCVELRKEVLDILSCLGKVPNNHPVYFFKSSCPPVEWEALTEYKDVFCHCPEKVGLRVITAMPESICLLGSHTVISLVKILNRVIKMNRKIQQLYPKITEISEPCDTGIYHKGRCVRLPHTFKVKETGSLFRLLKLLVCHPNPAEREKYVKEAFNLNNLLHHATPETLPENITTIYNIVDVNQDFLASKTKEQLPQSLSNVVQRIEALSGKYILDWCRERAWPTVLHNIKTYLPTEKSAQFNHISFTHNGGNIVQIKAHQGSNFKCLNYNHKTKANTVRLFLLLFTNQDTKVVITLMSQCFANKCNNNVSMAHFSVLMDILE